jgi:hypothetical protein
LKRSALRLKSFGCLESLFAASFKLDPLQNRGRRIGPGHA